MDLRDIQIAARHADPWSTMRYDRARKSLDRHPKYILAAYRLIGHSELPHRYTGRAARTTQCSSGFRQ